MSYIDRVGERHEAGDPRDQGSLTFSFGLFKKRSITRSNALYNLRQHLVEMARDSNDVPAVQPRQSLVVTLVGIVNDADCPSPKANSVYSLFRADSDRTPLSVPDLERAPIREIERHQGAEQAAVQRDAQMRQLVRDHEILEAGVLLIQARRQRDRSRRGARAPFARHPLNANDKRRRLRMLALKEPSEPFRP
jgi:hypothetical protein